MRLIYYEGMWHMEQEKTYLGIELGSTRIKAVLIGEDSRPIATGGYDWENRFENGLWTYRMEDVLAGLVACYKQLASEYRDKYGEPLTRVGAIGVSAMMHGYLPFDKDGRQLTAFRTWRNTTTEQAAVKLTELFGFNIPLRWSVAHLYQAILNGEPHVGDIGYVTTLAGYVHYILTGKRVIGIGDASGMFPIDSAVNDFNKSFIEKFNALEEVRLYAWTLKDILPKVLVAGEDAGALTEDGARLLDPSGALRPGVPFCPPEGDAGTGMTATNSVAVRTGNVSAGTSVFAMLVLEKELSKLYPEIDIVTTPTGRPVAMVHCNTCTSDIDAWVSLLGEAVALFGERPSKAELYGRLYALALEGDGDCGGLLSYNYLAGEPITGFDEGRPLFARAADSKFNLANFMRNLLFSSMATLKIGMDILTDKERVALNKLLGHGGFFKTKGVGQRLMAGALNVPVAVMESAGEGGAWGIALLASYMANKTETLEDFLERKVFAGNAGTTITPDERDRQGFLKYMERYEAGLAVQRSAVENI
jgi:sugar (pentulose or hexulose) kinase